MLCLFHACGFTVIIAGARPSSAATEDYPSLPNGSLSALQVNKMHITFLQKEFLSVSFASSEAPDLKQEERLQELESCSGVGSTSDDTEVREVSSRPSTPGLSVVSGRNGGSAFTFFLWRSWDVLGQFLTFRDVSD